MPNEPAEPTRSPGGILARVPFLGRIVGSPAFSDRDFRLLWGGVAFNAAGTAGEQVVVGLLIYRMTGSSVWVGVSLALFYLPLLFFGAAAGAIADWMDRRRLLRMLELAIAANLALFGILVATGAIETWQILIMTFVSGSVRAMHHPVRLSYAYDLVGGEQVVAGLGLLNLATRPGQLIGALAAGSAMERLGPEFAYFLLAGGQLCAYGLVRRLRSVGRAAETVRSPILENLREYLAEMRHNRTLLMLVVVTASVEVLGFSYATALPELATEHLGVGAEGLGILHACRAFGGVVAALALAGFGSFRRRGLVFLVVIYVFAASLLLLGAAPGFATALAAVALVSMLAGLTDILAQGMMQLSVPNRLRGRAMGAWVFAIGASPLGHLELGFLAATLGVAGALYINAIGLLAIAVVTTAIAPRLREL